MQEGNLLFPVFLKANQLNILLVGGGNVGLEKLSALLANSPGAQITLVAGLIRQEVKELAAAHPQVVLRERNFQWEDLDGRDLVFLATDNPALHADIKAETTRRHLLTNVADTPHLCDFYLGSIVQKGDLKIAISTNGKSPTLAKRLREVFQESLPDQLQEVLNHLQAFRNMLKGDFAEKVKTLDALTRSAIFTPDKKP
jgi:precorrin-2 dehydrogenase/sirohydrochlorin ferrochelatase